MTSTTSPGLVLPHQLWTGADLLDSCVATTFWWGLHAACAGAVDMRAEDRRDDRHRLGTGREPMPVRAGQFLPWRCRRGGRVAVGCVSTPGAARGGDHVVDPPTGEGISREASCSVVGPDLTWDDVWATVAWVGAVRAGSLMAHRDPSYRLLGH